MASKDDSEDVFTPKVDLTPEEEEKIASDLDLSKEEEEDEIIESDLDLSKKDDEDDDVLDLTSDMKVGDNNEENEDMEATVMDDIIENEMSEDLVSEETASAVSSEITKLLSANIAVERETEGKLGKVTLEDMALQLMKPLIKEWLDRNLHRIIEKVFTKEVEKIARRALDK